MCAVTECHSWLLRIQTLRHDFQRLATHDLDGYRLDCFPLLRKFPSELWWFRYPPSPLIFLLVFKFNTLPIGVTAHYVEGKAGSWELEVGNLGKYLRRKGTISWQEVYVVAYSYFSYSVASDMAMQASGFWLLNFLGARGCRHSITLFSFRSVHRRRGTRPRTLQIL